MSTKGSRGDTPAGSDGHVVSHDSSSSHLVQNAMLWIAGKIEQGMTRVYALSVEEDLSVVDQIDDILEQAAVLARQGPAVHAVFRRFDNHIVVAVDDGPESDWVLPAVRKRLAEVIFPKNNKNEIGFGQLVDLGRGEKLRLWNVEFRCVNGREGKRHAYVKSLQGDGPELMPIGGVTARRPWLSVAIPSISPVRRQVSLFFGCACASPFYRICQKGVAVQFGWRHVPILLYPLLAIMFGLASPLSFFCAVLLLGGNWRALLVLANYVRRRWLDAILIGCASGVVVCVFLSAWDLYSRRPRELPSPHMPLGFYIGRYFPSWESEALEYGLYLPPHFATAGGQFPMIVFLHGYGERCVDRVLAEGVPRSITLRFGEHVENGAFPFVGFFPVDPDGAWEFSAHQLEQCNKALDYVINRHRIDPERVYLTGHSSGGNGVWRWAEACPERWAAVAPVASFIDPEIAKVSRLPAWIFHGSKDTSASVERDRVLVKKLRQARSDVRYTEFANGRHVIGTRVYDSRDLYDWFAQKTRR